MNKGVIEYAKKNYIIIGVCVILSAVLLWMCFGRGIPDDGGAINQARTELESARTRLDFTERELAKSRTIVTELQQTNRDLNREIAESRAVINQIGQTNDDLAREISTIREFSASGSRRLAECQRILKEVRETGQVRNQ